MDIFLELGQQFSDAEPPGESTEQVAAGLVNLVLEARRRCHGVVGNTPEGDAVDADTIAKMAGWDADDPALLTVEKVLRRFATGRGVDGVVLLKRAITDRQRAISDEQRRRASRPRKRDPLQALIESIVATRPKITEKELLRLLRSNISRGVIEYIDDTNIVLEEGPPFTVKISSLKDRLTRAKKKFAKAG
ncbi:MAG: hypothetical protein WCL08_09935 [Verrucomicrobiota bacterium]